MAKPRLRQKREEARRLFLTGELDSNTAIARRLNTRPHTIGRWRKEEDWDALRLRVDRQSAERLVELLSAERTNLNLRHFKYWDAVLGQLAEVMKSGTITDVRELERVSHILNNAQRGQRLARGLSLDGKTEEQIRAEAQAEARGLVDVFIDAIKDNVPDEAARDRIRLAILEQLPQADSADQPSEQGVQ